MSEESALNVVVEGPTDASILRALLSKAQKAKMRFYSAGGRISLASVARNLLVHEGTPVLVVMDADTHNLGHAEELQDMTKLAMRTVAPSVPSDTFAFIPTIEAIFFESPQALQRLLGKRVPEEKLEEGAIAPRETLAKLLGDDGSKRKFPEWVTRIPPDIASQLASGRQASAFNATIDSMLSSPAKP
jgi:hypothetical protein